MASKGEEHAQGGARNTAQHAPLQGGIIGLKQTRRLFGMRLDALYLANELVRGYDLFLLLLVQLRNRVLERLLVDLQLLTLLLQLFAQKRGRFEKDREIYVRHQIRSPVLEAASPFRYLPFLRLLVVPAFPRKRSLSSTQTVSSAQMCCSFHIAVNCSVFTFLSEHCSCSPSPKHGRYSIALQDSLLSTSTLVLTIFVTPRKPFPNTGHWLLYLDLKADSAASSPPKLDTLQGLAFPVLFRPEGLYFLR